MGCSGVNVYWPRVSVCNAQPGSDLPSLSSALWRVFGSEDLLLDTAFTQSMGNRTADETAALSKLFYNGKL